MPFGVYVHYPYCSRLCPYCDFNVAVTPEIPHEAYRDAVVAELRRRASDFIGRPSPVSIYFGGGTPGLWPAEYIGSVITAIVDHFGLQDGAEVTVEMNPEDVDPARLAALRAAGVNRLSLGIQSFDDRVLSGLGRIHGAAVNRAAVADTFAAGFTAFSVDLIHGLAGQTVAGALADVAEACQLGAPHISTYQLTIEPHTAFGRRAARGERVLEDEDRLATLFDAIRETLHAGGVVPYEVSNAARPGAEAVHNQLYWTGGEYLALGAGAHGFRRVGDGAIRWENERHPGRYMAGALAGRPIETERRVVDPDTLLEERLFTGLRLDRGLAIDSALRQKFGPGAARQIESGHLEEVDERWRLTAKGRPLMDGVVFSIIESVS